VAGQLLARAGYIVNFMKYPGMSWRAAPDIPGLRAGAHAIAVTGRPANEPNARLGSLLPARIGIWLASGARHLGRFHEMYEISGRGFCARNFARDRREYAQSVG
jgi:hypothetical protein